MLLQPLWADFVDQDFQSLDGFVIDDMVEFSRQITKNINAIAPVVKVSPHMLV